MPTLAIRGATTASENTVEAVLSATRELLTEIIRVNLIVPGEVVSVLFTITPDVDAAFPSRAARELGWVRASLLDAQAPAIQGDLARCIRVLILLNRDAAPDSIRPVYLQAARALRPDLVGSSPSPSLPDGQGLRSPEPKAGSGEGEKAER